MIWGWQRVLPTKYSSSPLGAVFTRKAGLPQ